MKLLVVIPIALTIGFAALGLHRAVMNRRVGKLVAVAVAVALVAIGSSAACGSGNPKAVGGNATVTPTTAALTPLMTVPSDRPWSRARRASRFRDETARGA